MSEVLDLGMIWSELAADLPEGRAGRVRRLVHPAGACEQNVELTAPEQWRILTLSVPAELTRELDLPDPTSGISCRVVGGREAGRATIELAQTPDSDDELFTRVASDIAQAGAETETEEQAIAAWIGRLRRWQRLLHRAREGLSPERQRGLWGELSLIKDRLISEWGHIDAIESWAGAAGGPHDFRLPTGWIEVKTTAANRPAVVRINGERQLEVPADANLFLLHLAIDVRDRAGASLPSLVNEIRTTIDGTGAEEEFARRLVAAGYRDEHDHRYRRVGYEVRQMDLFRVEEGFPRLIEADLADGVGKVAYDLALDACRSFQCQADEVLAKQS